jgi:signal transduction histidine kinase
MRAMQKEAQFQQEKAVILAKSNKAEESARVRQEFLSTMSHEIRTPLNAITTIATLLNENTKPEERLLLDSLKFSSSHLMQIVNNILDYTKLDLGKMSLDLKLYNLKSLLENFWNANNFLAKEKGIKFKLKIDKALNDYYYYDETKISQILGNLVNNSLKFTDVGSIKLEVKVVNQSYNYDTLLFKVSDTGIGIEKENLDIVFESFSQVKTGITRKKDGTGLGLSITKKLIELYGSKINIQSKPESGSLFFFELKLKKSKNTEDNIQVNFVCCCI